MMYPVSLEAVSETMSFTDRLASAGKTTLMGMVATFIVLTIIMLIVQLMGKLAGGKKSVKEEPSAPPAPAAAEVTVQDTADEEEIAAAITAAVAAYLSEEGYNGAFRVVSFKKTATRSSWNKQ